MLLKLFFSHLFLISHIFLLTQGNFFPSPAPPLPRHLISILEKGLLKAILSFDTGRELNFVP